jgi:hypothetical protein
VDGPEFDGHQVDFDLLVTRLRMYLPEEKRAMEAFEEEVGERLTKQAASDSSAGEDHG